MADQWLWGDGSDLLWGDGEAMGGGQAPLSADVPASQTSPGGWRSPPGFERHETPEMRRRERERLGILPKQQRAIDRAAAKIVASAPTVARGGLLAVPQVIAAPQFDRLLSIVQPTEGQVMALAQAIVDRIAWIVAQEAADAEETEQILRLMMEM